MIIANINTSLYDNRTYKLKLYGIMSYTKNELYVGEKIPHLNYFISVASVNHSTLSQGEAPSIITVNKTVMTY